MTAILPQAATSGRGIEFLAVGHLTLDQLATGLVLGGAAAYAALTARRLGLRTGLVTAVAPDFSFWEELSEIESHVCDSPVTTRFENRYLRGERRQRLLTRAETLAPDAMRVLGARLAEDAIVFYGPVAAEWTAPFERSTAGGLSVVTPQGFYRSWDEEGFIVATDWPAARRCLAGVDLVSVSELDGLSPDLAAAIAPGILAVTLAERGVRLHLDGAWHSIAAYPVPAQDPTGAGDVFAAALAVALREGRPALEAAEWACCAASFVVAASGTKGIADRDAVEARHRAYRKLKAVKP